MKFVANLVGILSIPIYWVVLSRLFAALFLALTRLSQFFGVDPWFVGGVGIWFILPVGFTLSIWLGHTTCRFLLRRWSHAANVLDENKADTGARS